MLTERRKKAAMARQTNPSDMKKALKIADAALSGNLELLKQLGERIPKKKKVRIGQVLSSLRKKDGNGAIHFAAGQGCIGVCNLQWKFELGKLPIIVAAEKGKKEIVETLFPLTTPIPTVPNWSIDGLFKYVESQEYKKEREVLSKKRLIDLNKKIKAVLSKKQYLVAQVLCTYALNECPENDASEYYAKRSQCWMHLGSAQCGATSITYKLNSTKDASLFGLAKDIRSLGKDYLSRNDHFGAVLSFAAGVRFDSEDFKNEMKGVMDSVIKSGDHLTPREIEEIMGDPEFSVTFDLNKMTVSIRK